MTLDYSKPETLPCGTYLVRCRNDTGTTWHMILTKCPEGWFTDWSSPEMWGLDVFADEVTVVRSLEDADALARDLELVDKFRASHAELLGLCKHLCTSNFYGGEWHGAIAAAEKLVQP